MALHFIDGEKGGVGKSFVTMVLVEYCRERLIEFTLIEADTTNPDIKEGYEEAQLIQFGFSESQMQNLDELFERGKKETLIINLPSRIRERLDYWIEESGIIELSKEAEIPIYKWFVCTGQTESMRCLRESIEAYGKTFPHILVKNYGMLQPEDWQQIEKGDEEFNRIRKEEVIGEIEIGKVSTAELSKLAKEKKSLAKARQAGVLTIVARSRFERFLKNAFASIDKLELLTGEKKVSGKVCKEKSEEKGGERGESLF